MKNSEKYKTPEEKARAFMENRNTFCTIETDDLFADLCACLSWLEKEVPAGEELKPCPFCGKETSTLEYYGSRYRVYCTKCHIQTTDYKTREGATNAWNKRP